MLPSMIWKKIKRDFNLTKGPHLINHSCMPNCWIYIFHGHTLFFALRNILPGEELTISYLLSPLDETCNLCTHDCKCGNRLCTGTMHLSKNKYKKWQKFQDNERDKTVTAKFVFGKNLQKLDFYPKIISDNLIVVYLNQI